VPVHFEDVTPVQSSAVTTASMTTAGAVTHSRRETVI